jgi:cell surface protein SprA
LSETFKRFQDNRIILSQRLGAKNPYSNQIGADGYYKGYGRYAQDVLIPAFIAAYTNKDPKTIGLIKSENGNYVKSNPFSGYIPKPNWRLTYNGLTNYPLLAKIFTNISLTHGYTSTLGMNSFNSALLFQDRLFLGYPSFVDTISGNFIPYFLVPNISISEQFSPLAGIDFSTKSQISGRFEYRKSRQLSLSLIDYQLSEVRSTEITVSAKYRKRDVKLPFKFKLNFNSKDTTKAQHDISFGLNLSFRDDVNTNSRLDQTNATATGGQKVFTIKPTIDYVMSNRVSIQFYFDQRRVTPYISSSAPMVNTRAGVQVRISLAQ